MTIHEFSGRYRFLSNFYACTIKTRYGVWPSAEHLYQAAKTNDLADKERIRLVISPGRAKRMGQNVALRTDWENIKTGIMIAIIRLKFSQNEDLTTSLLGTGDNELIEGNSWHDNIWGNCICSKCEDIVGQNLLGEILMKVRSELRQVVTKIN